jgi:hypothetical protein
VVATGRSALNPIGGGGGLVRHLLQILGVHPCRPTTWEEEGEENKK